MALRLRSVTIATVGKSRLQFSIEIMVGIVVTAVAGYFLVYRSVTEISDTILVFRLYSPGYFSAVFILMTFLYAACAWNRFGAPSMPRGAGIQVFSGRQLPGLGTLVWGTTYRLTYLALSPGIFCSWPRSCYLAGPDVLCGGQSPVAEPQVLCFPESGLFFCCSILSCRLSVRFRTDFPHHAYLRAAAFFCVEMAVGCPWVVFAGLFIFSGKMRRRVHFFISTHFYINKYEYRDEWLAFSQHYRVP